MMASSSEPLRPDQIKPVGPWVFLRIEKRKEKVGSIHLPAMETNAEKVQEKAGRVIAMGPGIPDSKGGYHVPKGLEVGCRVMYRGFLDAANHGKNIFGLEFEDGEEYCLMHMKDLLMVIPDDLEIGHLVAREEE